MSWVASWALVAAEMQGAADLSWFEGCWETESGNTREVWQAEGDDLLFGYNVVLKNGDVGFFEQLRLEHSGFWVFSAYPRGIGPATFSLAENSTRPATFTNSEHDFPQRLHYERQDDRLIAVASLIDGSNAQTWSFNPCVAR